MRYFAIYENENLLAIGTGACGVEISKNEYDELLIVIREKAMLVDRLYKCEIAIEDVPSEWKEEIQNRVEERISQEGTFENKEISAEEALEIILGGETV